MTHELPAADSRFAASASARAHRRASRVPPVHATTSRAAVAAARVGRRRRVVSAVATSVLLAAAAPLHAQVGADRAAVEPRSISFPAAVVEEFEATGGAFLPGTGMAVTLGEGITAVVGVAASPDEHLLIVDGVVVGLSTDENATDITRSSEIEVMRPLAIDQPGAARFGRPILLITTRNAEARPTDAPRRQRIGDAVVILRQPNQRGSAPAPLFVIDGVVVRGEPRLTPDRIESIEVIKGAAAQERFGARAANGVILITTKK